MPGLETGLMITRRVFELMPSTTQNAIRLAFLLASSVEANLGVGEDEVVQTRNTAESTRRDGTEFVEGISPVQESN